MVTWFPELVLSTRKLGVDLLLTFAHFPWLHGMDPSTVLYIVNHLRITMNRFGLVISNLVICGGHLMVRGYSIGILQILSKERLVV